MAFEFIDTLPRIKFRGISLNNPKYVYGDLIHKDGVPVQIMDGSFATWIDPNTASLFTNLLDKDGTELYANDIILFDTLGYLKLPSVIEWSKHECCFVAKSYISSSRHNEKPYYQSVRLGELMPNCITRLGCRFDTNSPEIISKFKNAYNQ